MAIEKNTVVGIEYEVKDAATGEAIDGNVGGAPLEFMMGSGHIVPGLEEAIALMSLGESKSLVVEASKAYGEYNEEAIEEIEKEQFAGIDLAVGMTLYGQSESGQTVQVTVKAIGDETVTIDYNHPLAGKNLAFDVKILTTRDATEEEIANGGLFGSCGCGEGGCGCGHEEGEDHECCGGHHHGEGHSCGCR